MSIPMVFRCTTRKHQHGVGGIDRRNLSPFFCINALMTGSLVRQQVEKGALRCNR